MTRVKFWPEAWQRDYAIPVDPEGPTEWEATPDFVRKLVDRYGPAALEESTDASDRLREDPAAPEWVREWHGPFYCEVIEQDEDEDEDEEVRAQHAVEKAQERFWHEVALRYPEVKTGDFPPDASHEFSTACETAVERWLTFNRTEAP